MASNKKNEYKRHQGGDDLKSEQRMLNLLVGTKTSKTVENDVELTRKYINIKYPSLTTNGEPMNQRRLFLFAVVAILSINLTACSPKSALTIEAYAIRTMDWEGESLVFEPLEGTREAILAKREVERSQPAVTFTPPVALGSDVINAVERYMGSQVAVDVTRNDLLVLTVDAGVISPINNLRGLWVVGEQWFLEVAHVEENPTDPNAAFIMWGEIFTDGSSLNAQHGYDEAFNFQILDGKPFFFFSKAGELGYSYDGRETKLDYTDIPHYLCCSASAFNPLPAEKMVAFYASAGDAQYYVEIGAFQ
jgi:hypothetical protein